MASSCSARPTCCSSCPPSNAATLTGREFFPHLISGPFHDGLIVVFTAAAIMSLVAAAASLIKPKAGSDDK